MSITTLATRPALPIDELRALVGDENVIGDAGELAFYSTDVYRRAQIDAALTRSVLEGLKNAVDPRRLMNPGALGLA